MCIYLLMISVDVIVCLALCRFITEFIQCYICLYGCFICVYCFPRAFITKDLASIFAIRLLFRFSISLIQVTNCVSRKSIDLSFLNWITLNLVLFGIEREILSDEVGFDCYDVNCMKLISSHFDRLPLHFRQSPSKLLIFPMNFMDFHYPQAFNVILVCFFLSYSTLLIIHSYSLIDVPQQRRAI